MDKKNNQITANLNQLYTEKEAALSIYQSRKEELEQFLAQFTCVLDAPSCGCSEEELNDPKFDAVFTEYDHLSKLSKEALRTLKEIEAQIAALEEETKSSDK